MRLEIHGVDLKIGPELEERIKSKLNKYEKYFDDSALCQVKGSTDGPNLKRIEITLNVDGRFYRAERSEEDIFTALDSALEVLNGQIRKHKTIMASHRNFNDMHKFALEELVNDETEEVEEEFNARYKEFEIHPMTDEEAALQMELLGHSFFIYLDEEDGKVNVIYKRRGDSFGVIEPIY